MKINALKWQRFTICSKIIKQKPFFVRFLPKHNNLIEIWISVVLVHVSHIN